MGFLLSTIVAGLVYYIACRIWPVAIYPAELDVDNNKDKSWEAMGHTEGFFAEDEVVPEYLREVFDGSSRVYVEMKEAGDRWGWAVDAVGLISPGDTGYT